ncbi:transcriptional regulator, HxlR family [Sphingomonas laterariae]|uniref:Transcriptional regulator, HxlR family n=1 Tax=Edaphosphingomonas laterariae TaxID=861865 RepID=A0A239G1S6_9SPHN|nr:helix-turn-helix domain-containing protein [Sphingomonas laterariae]SNS62433.1 transcriptional regulator, HxlR family [Sphingomonas laterariae]
MKSIDQLKRTVIQCSLPAALEAMGERWSFMILRATFNGLSHFEQFQTTLGIARNILANRLQRLVDHGILERHGCPEDRRKVEYRLTEKGEALLPTLIALRQWGEKWEANIPNNPVLVDSRDGKPVADILVRAHDGRPLGLGDLRWVDRADLEADQPRCIYTGEPVGAK